jgi:hypothetical protein
VCTISKGGSNSNNNNNNNNNNISVTIYNKKHVNAFKKKQVQDSSKTVTTSLSTTDPPKYDTISRGHKEQSDDRILRELQYNKIQFNYKFKLQYNTIQFITVTTNSKQHIKETNTKRTNYRLPRG